MTASRVVEGQLISETRICIHSDIKAKNTIFSALVAVEGKVAPWCDPLKYDQKLCRVKTFFDAILALFA